MKTFKTPGFLLVLLVMVFSLSAIAMADDVTDSINEGLQYYKDGQFTDAVSSLNYAEQLIQQKKSSGLETFLPDPLSGWEAEAASSQAMGAALMGGGITAERDYHKSGSAIHIQIVADSPVLSSVMMMISNPMFATADGGKMVKIAGQKGILKHDAAQKSGDLQIVVANRFLVSVEGNGVSEQELKDYAGAIDYNKMAKLP